MSIRVFKGLRWAALVLCSIAPATALAETGVTLESVLTVDSAHQLRGGITAGSRSMVNLDFTAAWQLGGRWEAFGYVIADQGGGFTEHFSGDSQTVSNIDVPEGIRLFEAWVRYTSPSDKWTVTSGILNANGLFDTQPYATAFVNSSHGMGADVAQSGAPAFPFTSLGLAGEWRASARWTVRAGLFDGVSGPANNGVPFVSIDLSKKDGIQAMTEAAYVSDNGFLKAGYWINTSEQERLDGTGLSRERQGQYFQAGRQFNRESNDASQGLTGWVRFGTASGGSLPVSNYTGGGVTYTGLFPGRPTDQLGVAVASVRFSDLYQDTVPTTTKSETTWEITYQAEVTRGLIIQPDLQYVSSPSGTDADDGLVFVLRLRSFWTNQ